MKKITDPSFKYVPSFGTDLRKRFRAEQRRIEEEKYKQAADAKEASIKVAPIKRAATK